MRDHDHDQDDSVPTRESYAWQPGEREQIEREMAERQRQLDARQRQIDAERLIDEVRQATARDEVVTKAAPRQRHHPEAAAAATASSAARQWQRYINRLVDKRQRIALTAVGTIIREERAERDRAAAELRDMIARLQLRVEQLEQRGPSRSLRAIGGE